MKYQSFEGAKDIIILASKDFSTLKTHENNIDIELTGRKKELRELKTRLKLLVRAQHEITKLYGHADSNNILRIVITPRAGWSYSRIPVIIISRAYEKSSKGDPLAFEFNIQGMIHEIAHFWWNIANTNTTEDWINEGLAEFTAFFIAKNLFGNKYYENNMTEYRKQIKEIKTNSAIIATELGSPDQYRNRYVKPALMFETLRKRYGDAKLFNFLKILYLEFKWTKNANTKQFIALLEKNINKDAAIYFDEKLKSTNWNE